MVGGAFAINGGALGASRGNVFYFSPYALAWEDTEKGLSAFVHWTFDGDLQLFYENIRWPRWEAEVERVGGDEAFGLIPPPWTVEGKDLSKMSRRAVPAVELWRLQQEFAAQLRGA